MVPKRRCEGVAAAQLRLAAPGPQVRSGWRGALGNARPQVSPGVGPFCDESWGVLYLLWASGATSVKRVDNRSCSHWQPGGLTEPSCPPALYPHANSGRSSSRKSQERQRLQSHGELEAEDGSCPRRGADGKARPEGGPEKGSMLGGEAAIRPDKSMEGGQQDRRAPGGLGEAVHRTRPASWALQALSISPRGSSLFSKWGTRLLRAELEAMYSSRGLDWSSSSPARTTSPTRKGPPSPIPHSGPLHVRCCLPERPPCLPALCRSPSLPHSSPSPCPA